MHFMSNWSSRDGDKIYASKKTFRSRKTLFIVREFLLSSSARFFRDSKIQNLPEKNFFYFYYSNAIKRIMKNFIGEAVKFNCCDVFGFVEIEK